MRAGRPFLFTFYLANAVPIHPTRSDKVEGILEKHAGKMLAPPSSYERLCELGDFDETSFTIRGRGWDEAAVDVVLPGLGWVAITGSGECDLGVSLPKPVVPILREPLVLSEGERGIKGTLKGNYVKFTGSKLRDGRGNTARGNNKPKKRQSEKRVRQF